METGMELVEAIETPVYGDFNYSVEMAETAGVIADGRRNTGERWRHSRAKMLTWNITEIFAGADVVVWSAKVKTVAGII
ncbi:hypothetical protein T4B_11530 [Trichinella pseudospiralis]|uniref:Uncharacterized protein n=1 Tax=Trichinella pseudospiralis TaxID=6337 RepID=A0A0V1JH17_TRIPS|nr:hypothetical protein T4B_11530 [Trichinella pseudospiralis]KRZ45827.1 hypothetical protein T4C_11942 [Trichinella pseudospiralis]